MDGLTSGSTETMNGRNLTLSLETFNCNGYKQSSDFVINRMTNVDVMCLCETWLKPQENNLISDTLNNSSTSGEFLVFSKSSMVDSYVQGRPYGGVAIICKKRADLCYTFLPCDNDRRSGYSTCRHPYQRQWSRK